MNRGSWGQRWSRATWGRRSVESRKSAISRVLPVPEEQPLPSNLRPLLERWRDGLGNRNAEDDRSRIDRHILSPGTWQSNGTCT
jgi:hypothetical protein